MVSFDTPHISSLCSKEQNKKWLQDSRSLPHGFRYQMEMNFNTEDAKQAFVARIDRTKRFLGALDSRELIVGQVGCWCTLPKILSSLCWRIQVCVFESFRITFIVQEYSLTLVMNSCSCAN